MNPPSLVHVKTRLRDVMLVLYSLFRDISAYQGP